MSHNYFNTAEYSKNQSFFDQLRKDIFLGRGYSPLIQNRKTLKGMKL